MENIQNLSVSVVGGGPAGLMAAEAMARRGLSVTVYDSMPMVGRKLLLAGAHGGLNLTHDGDLADFVERYGASKVHLYEAFKKFSPDDLRNWCHELGLPTFVGSSGCVFPKEMHAKGLLRSWLSRLRELGVRFVLKHKWQGWSADGELVFLKGDGEEVTVRSDITLLALGGASWPRTGSDGSWYETLEQESVALTPLEPANCGFDVPWSPYIAHRFAGSVLKPVKLTFDGQEKQGEITLTEKGLEGSLIYAYSSAIRQKLNQEGKAILYLDLRMGLSQEDLVEKLALPRKAQSFSTYLRKTAGLHPVSIALLREAVPPEKLPVNNIEALAGLIKALPIVVTRTAPIHRAISTAGGVKFEALDEYFMLKSRKGTFIAGEMLDWEAPTGGYLLQACFSTGRAAAEGILRYAQNELLKSVDE